MNLSVNTQTFAQPLTTTHRTASPNPQPEQNKDSVELGRNSVSPILTKKPEFAAKDADKPKPVEVHAAPKSAGLSGITKAVAMGMAGLTLVGALTGCKGPEGPTTSTPVNQEALNSVTETFEQLTKNAEDGEVTDFKAIAGDAMKAIGEYGRASGAKGQELMDQLGGVIREHPVVAASIAFTVGTGIGIGVNRLGVPDAAMEGGQQFLDWMAAKDVPQAEQFTTRIKRGAIVLGITTAVVGGGYLLYDHVIKPMAEVPNKPTGEHAEAMEATFDQLEKELANYEGDAQEKAGEVALTLGQKIQEYAKATGRSAAEVKDDVIAWAYEHPIVATSLVMGAGVATGVVLDQVGLPDYIADFAGVAFEQAGDGLSGVVDWAKENPVVAGAVVAGVAAGAGYVVYRLMQPDAPAQPAPAVAVENQ